MNEWEVILNRLRNLMDDVTNSLARGECKDFADYRYRTGTIYGLALAERDILDLKEQIEKAE